MTDPTDTPTSTLTDGLRHHAAGVHGAPLTLDAVTGRARSIRRRRRAATAGGVLAVLAVAVPLAGPWVTGPGRADGPVSPATAPATSPGNAQGTRAGELRLDLPSGSAPAVPYELVDDLVLVTPAGRSTLREVLPQLVLVGDAWVGLGLTGGGDRLDVVHLLETEGRGPGPATLGNLAVRTRTPAAVDRPSLVTSEDGSRVAWTEAGAVPGDSVLVVADTATGEETRLGIGSPAQAAVGFAADGVVVAPQDPDLAGTYRVVDDQPGAVEGPFSSLTTASAPADLVAGTASYDEASGAACAGVAAVGAVRTTWQTCEHALTAFSPDGELVVGLDPATSARPQGASTGLALLDADDGSVVAGWALADAGTGVRQVQWEDADHLLAVLDVGGREGVVRLGTDGSAELAVAPVPVAGLERAIWLTTAPYAG